MTRYPTNFRFKEWSCTGNVIDHEEAVHECELCGMTGLRYHFEIEHEDGVQTMQVGSECILRFEIPYFENGARVEDKAAVRRSLNKRVDQAKLRAAIAAIKRLGGADDGLLRSAVQRLQGDEPLTPKQASAVLWLLAKHRVEHSPSTFKVRLKRESDRDALMAMSKGEQWRVRYLWPALTSAQRALARKLGVPEP